MEGVVRSVHVWNEVRDEGWGMDGGRRLSLTLHAPRASAVIGSCAIVDRMNRGEQFPCDEHSIQGTKELVVRKEKEKLRSILHGFHAQYLNSQAATTHGHKQERAN